MIRSRGLAVICAIFVGMLCVSQALGQGKTSVQIAPIGDQELRTAAGKNASAVITALNQAAYFSERPDLSDLPVAERAHEDLLSRWEDGQFFCNQTRLDRSLVLREDGVYEIRDIPLIVEDEEQRQGILAVNTEGTVIGFRYSDEPATGTLIVTSEPSGATAVSSAGDTLTQTTPARFENVPKGQHELTIRKEAYEKVDTTFAVQPYQSTRDTVHLTPTFGYLRIQADVGTVRVDGTERSPSEDGRIQVEAGEHVVELSGQYYQVYDTTLTVLPGQTEVLSPQVQRKSVPLRVRSAPTGATVIVDGDEVGTTPLEKGLEAGRTYALRVDAERHIPSTQIDIFAEPDSVIEREVVLNPVETQTEGGDVQIENVRVERSERQVDITYDLTGNSDETYPMRLSITDREGEPVEGDLDVVRGAIGGGIAPGPDKNVQLEGALPDGATVRLVQGSPSAATSLTVGYFVTDFQFKGSGNTSPFDFDEPLNTIVLSGKIFSGRMGSISAGYKNYKSNINGWALNITSKIGDNFHVLKYLQKYPSLVYIPIRARGEFIHSDLSRNVDGKGSSQSLLNVGFGTGVGGRFRLGDFPEIRKVPVLNSFVLEGSLLFAPGGYFGDNRQLSRARDISFEIKLVKLISTGTGGGIGVTFGFTHRILSRTFEQPANVGEVLDAAFGTAKLNRISTQRLFRVGINWQ